ncbi:uroporphyrinogen-III C-methyltransferase [Opitutales bacterium ASA1]|uniref:uroporphyrinogen-III C-methyltransferase n=1 Tax=Congregicoccus parvus TaxID=3081749 RepID=UPI002B2BE28F|nr:uroporphyrinogen-III C-methyltransferase [Opitutales bacterium ASA1]
MSEGRVFLVGAGPGDPGLLTVRGRALLESAEVVVYDRLVHLALLALCPPECERICVGKKAGGDSVDQEEIGALLVEHALAGKQVVRLKGGDPFVFGRGGEEAEVLAQAGVAFEIVPGVTSSLAAGSFAGIPLTHREIASTLVFATGHEDPAKRSASVDWRTLGALRQATLCIYMGMGRLETILVELVAGGLAPDTPAACVQWASLGTQRTVTATVGTLVEETRRAGLAAPSIVLVGEVIRKRESIAWFEQRPLLGRRIVVTRNREKAGELSGRLERLGATVLELPLVSIRPKVDREVCGEVFTEIGTYDWLVFSSANGVRCFFDLFFAAFKDVRALGVMRIAAVGEATARAIRDLHLEVEIVPERAVAEDLASALVETGSLDSAKVLVVTGNLGRDVLVRKLEEARAIVDRFPVYENLPTDLSDDAVARDFREHGADAVLFTSSSAAKSFADQQASLELTAGAVRPLVGSIGPITSATLRELEFGVDFEAEKSTLDSLVAAVVERLQRS